REFISPLVFAFFVYCCRYRTFSYNPKLSFWRVWISPRREEITVNCFRRSSSSCAFLARKRSRCCVIIGRIPEVSGPPDLEKKSSRGPMIELVGDVGRCVGGRKV